MRDTLLKKWHERHFSDGGIRMFASSEMPKGSLWLPAVNAQLQQADAGLVCLTAKSLDSHWMFFQAGALSIAVALKTGEARIFTYLLGVHPAALQGPLSACQSTVATMEDAFLLINSLLGYLKRDQMGVGAFTRVWDGLWPTLQLIKREPVTSVFPGQAGLYDRKTFQEPVHKCTDQFWFKRYDGAMATRDALQAQKKPVAAECDAQFAGLFRDLATAADGYAMGMSALLFEPKTIGVLNTSATHLIRSVGSLQLGRQHNDG